MITDFIYKVICVFNVRGVKNGERFKVKINVSTDAR